MKSKLPPPFDLYTDGDEGPAPVKDDRTFARQIALQALYEIDCAEHEPMQVIDMHQRRQNPNRRASRYFRQLVLGTWEHRFTTDEAIQRFAPEYPLDQIAIIDRNILRMAIYEFAVSRITPIGAAIDEAVELAKQFGGEAAPAFVNGVLGSLADDQSTLDTLRLPDPPEPEGENADADEELTDDDET
ncbi:MAG: transcription antitermination factor NusB [bacterium]|nr:transcription antitermination factor NusB [bacterium]